jgi:hypothetical protein
MERCGGSVGSWNIWWLKPRVDTKFRDTKFSGISQQKIFSRNFVDEYREIKGPGI